MPKFDFPHPRRYNSLRLTDYDYNSVWQLCAIVLVTDQRRPLFADVDLAKTILNVLLSDETLSQMRLRAFSLMPDHLHFLAGVRDPKRKCALMDWRATLRPEVMELKNWPNVRPEHFRRKHLWQDAILRSCYPQRR